MRNLIAISLVTLIAMSFTVSCSKSDDHIFSGELLREGYISAYSHPDERIDGGSIIFQVTRGARNCELVKISRGEESVIKTFLLKHDEGHVLCSTPYIGGDDVLNIGFILNAPIGRKGDAVDLEYDGVIRCAHGAGSQGVFVGGDEEEKEFIVFYRVMRQECDHEWFLSYEGSIELLKEVTENSPVDYILLRVVEK